VLRWVAVGSGASAMCRWRPVVVAGGFPRQTGVGREGGHLPKGSLAIGFAGTSSDPYSRTLISSARSGHGAGRGTAPSLLMLVTVLQFVEQLTDRQAVEAVAGRIDWKYALCLEIR